LVAVGVGAGVAGLRVRHRLGACRGLALTRPSCTLSAVPAVSAVSAVSAVRKRWGGDRPLGGLGVGTGFGLGLHTVGAPACGLPWRVGVVTR